MLLLFANWLKKTHHYPPFNKGAAAPSWGHRTSCAALIFSCCHLTSSRVSISWDVIASYCVTEIKFQVVNVHVNVIHRIRKMSVTSGIFNIFLFGTFALVTLEAVTSGCTTPWAHYAVSCHVSYRIVLINCPSLAGLILGLRPASERRRYFVKTSLIGWAQAYSQPCLWDMTVIFKMSFSNASYRIKSWKLPLKLLFRSMLVQVMAWCRQATWPDPMLTQIYVPTWRHQATISWITELYCFNTLRPRQVATIAYPTFSNVFSWLKMNEFRLRFRWGLFLRLKS